MWPPQFRKLDATFKPDLGLEQSITLFPWCVMWFVLTTNKLLCLSSSIVYIAQLDFYIVQGATSSKLFSTSLLKGKTIKLPYLQM